MKKILLIGGTGFIGSHLKRALTHQSYEITIMCRQVPPCQEEPDVTYLLFNPDEEKDLDTILSECSHVIHLASATTPSTSMLKPEMEIINNLLPVSRLLERLQKYPEIHLIFISSGGAIYGNTYLDFVKEDTVLHPLSYYGAGKAAIEAFLYAFHEQAGNRVTVVRPSNLYGEGQPLKSQFGLIPTLFNHLINDSEMQIWGDGETIRDYLYIGDFVDLCIRIIQSATDGNSYETINAGSGYGLSINQLCDLAESITEQTIQRQYVASRTVDVKRIVLDSSKAENRFGWKASTPVKTGLEKTWEGFLHNTKRHLSDRADAFWCSVPVKSGDTTTSD